MARKKRSSLAKISAIFTQERRVLLLQLLLTILILGFLSGNELKLITLLAVWLTTFQRFSSREIIALLVINVLFTGMNNAAIDRGVFRFEHPDYLNLPVWEFFMWGFYILHTIRFIASPPKKSRLPLALGLAILFSIPFATIGNDTLLLSALVSVLIVSFYFFHEPEDWTYFGYMTFIGVLVECTGVWTHQWTYPSQPSGGIPLWFIPMWGGIGLFARQLLTPFLASRNR